MAQIQIVFLWHQHQPYYKDLATGAYRLPWVRMHALKDYYGMVKLLEEFPRVHQTINLVPSLVAQIQDYAAGSARDPFLDVAAKPAASLSPDERRFAVTYLFQANETRLIGRYPRYRELWERVRAAGSAEKAAPGFSTQDLADLQVLSQLAWFDEFFLEKADVVALAAKGRDYSEDDQRFVISKQREIIAAVLPAHAEAARAGRVELSTSPFYHPILPLVCDSDVAGISHSGVALPRRFTHPEDAREQLQRALEAHERTFGVKPRGVWPSEGSVSEQVLGIAHELGVEWMATDEGVLGRSLGYHFDRDDRGILKGEGAQRLYRFYRYERGATEMHLLFRDHAISDLIGFVYSGMPAREAAAHFLTRVRENARPVLQSGRDAVVPIILDGENAWEFYPESGREFLRRVYAGIEQSDDIVALTVSEAKERATLEAKRAASAGPRKQDAPAAPDQIVARLTSLMPGSWINANFDVWLGAAEDNRAWDYLNDARNFYDRNAAEATAEQRALAMEELLIAEGSDWNWWYGPEHHTANDADFDELYRKHLSNVYTALGAAPPDGLAQPIAGAVARPLVVPQTAYIRPRLDVKFERYFDWVGAAMYTTERRAGAMHGAQFLLETLHAGIDEQNIYVRVEFMEGTLERNFTVVVNLECEAHEKTIALRLEAEIEEAQIREWHLRDPADPRNVKTVAGSDERRKRGLELRLLRAFEFKLPLEQLNASDGATVRVRASVWRERLPVDAMPVEGWMELQVASEDRLYANAYEQ